MKRFTLLMVLFLSITLGQNQTQIDSINHVLTQLPNNSQLAIAIINKDTVSYYGAMNSNGTIEAIDNHDHIFVNYKDKDLAFDILNKLKF